MTLVNNTIRRSILTIVWVGGLCGTIFVIVNTIDRGYLEVVWQADLYSSCSIQGVAIGVEDVQLVIRQWV